MNPKEFYFIRHGQTDHNSGKIKGEHLDISLNKVAYKQAVAIEPFFTALSLSCVFSSPLKRGKEITDILLHNLSLKSLEIIKFIECDVITWNSIRKAKFSDSVSQFLQRVEIGLKRVLEEKDFPLIVAHGGIYFAICQILGIATDGIIDNCVLVCFHFEEKKCSWKIRDCILDDRKSDTFLIQRDIHSIGRESKKIRNIFSSTYS